jgi:hypothetical protein
MINNWVKVDRSQFNELQEAIQGAVEKLNEIKIKNKMLEDENKFLKSLLEKMASRPINDPISPQPQPNTPQWPSIRPIQMLDQGCAVCGISGVNGYCCTRQNCPTGVSCKTNSSS